MAEVTPFASVLEANNRAKALVKGDLEKLSNYLYSGGSWTDIEQPYMYLKKCMCRDTLIGYRKALDKKLNEGANQTIALLIDTLREFIQSRIPRKSRLTQMFERAFKVGQMGKNGANVDTFTDQLILEMEICQWASMTVAEATVLLWLKDIDSNDKDQEELGKLVNKQWDEAEKQDVVFTVDDCRAIAPKHWESVRQNQITMNKTQNVNGLVITKDDEKAKEKKEKKKAKKALKAAKKKEEQVNAATKQEDKAGEKPKDAVV